MIPWETYRAAAQRDWQPGERFRMFFRLDGSQGKFYTGRVESVEPLTANGMMPWECLHVRWQRQRGAGEAAGAEEMGEEEEEAGGAAEDRVNPWEIEDYGRKRVPRVRG